MWAMHYKGASISGKFGEAAVQVIWENEDGSTRVTRHKSVHAAKCYISKLINAQ